MVKILVVDDEIKIAEVVKAYLEKEGYEIEVAYSGKEALKRYEDNNFNVIILDLMLPDISGEDICKKIRETSDIPIIMLTAKVEEEDILNGFSLGSDDYVVKPFSPKQLVARVNAVIRRTGAINQEKILCFDGGELKIDIESYEVTKRGEQIILTPSEYKLLLTLSESPKQVFTRNQLLDKILGDDVEVYDRIIDSHIKNLRAKLEDDTRNPKYILTVHGIGYKFGGEKYEKIKT